MKRDKLITIKAHEEEKQALREEAKRRNTSVGAMLLKPFKKLLKRKDK